MAGSGQCAVWLTKEDGHLSNLEATVVAKQATRLTQEKCGPQIFKDLGECVLDLIGMQRALPEGWGSLVEGRQPIWIRCQPNHFGVNIRTPRTVHKDTVLEELWCHKASRSSGRKKKSAWGETDAWKEGPGLCLEGRKWKKYS